MNLGDSKNKITNYDYNELSNSLTKLSEALNRSALKVFEDDTLLQKKVFSDFFIKEINSSNNSIKKIAEIVQPQVSNSILNTLKENSAIKAIGNTENILNKICYNYNSNILFKQYDSQYIYTIIKILGNLKNTKYLDYMNLSNKIYNNNQDEIIKPIENEHKKIDDIKLVDSLNEIDSSNILTSQYDAIPKYVSFAFAKKSNYSIEEAYDKSIIKEISDVGKNIIKNLLCLKKIYKNKYGKDLIQDSDMDEFVELANNIQSIAENDAALEVIINKLFRVLIECCYEPANEENKKTNKIYELCEEIGAPKFGIDLIKWFRSKYDHIPREVNKKQRKKIENYIKETIKKEIPIKNSDFVKIQKSIYVEINNTLISIIEIINNLED